MRLRVKRSVLVALLGLCPFAFADGIQDLPDIYATPIPTEIRRNFDDIVRIHDTCPTCPLGVLDGEQFLDVYAKKFLVLGLEPHGFGGVWAIVAVEGEPRNAFRLWLYDIGEAEYDLRSIEELPGALEEELVRQIQNPEYRHYWL